MEYQNELKTLLSSDYSSRCALQHAEKLKAAHIPRRLFKYRSFDTEGRNLDALRNDRLWCSSPFEFNDPYDCSLHFSLNNLHNIMRKSLEKINKILPLENGESFFLPHEVNEICHPDSPPGKLVEILQRKGMSDTTYFEQDLDKLIHEPRDTLEKRMREGLHIGSLSEHYDSILMWSHYAENHKGFVVEYDFSSSHSQKPLWPVHYQKEVYDISNTIFGAPTSYINDVLMIAAATFKSDEWAYEKEWRIVRLRMPQGKGSAINTPKPSAIYLGAQITDENKNNISEIAASYSIPLYRMQRERGLFRMSEKRI